MSINFTPANREYLTVDILACTATFDENRLAFTITDEKTTHPKVRFRTTANFEDDILAGFPYGEWNNRVVFDSPAISKQNREHCWDLRSPLFSGGYALRREEAALICPTFVHTDAAILTGHYDAGTGIFTVSDEGIFDTSGEMLLTVDQNPDDFKLKLVFEDIALQPGVFFVYSFELNQATRRNIAVLPIGATFTGTGAFAKDDSESVRQMLENVAERNFGKERRFEYHCSRNAVAFTNAYVVDQYGNVIEPNKASKKECGRGVELKVKAWNDLRKTDAVLTCRTNSEGAITIEVELVSGEPLEKLTVLQARQLCVVYKQIARWAAESFQEYNLDEHRQFTPPEFPLERLMYDDYSRGHVRRLDIGDEMIADLLGSIP